MERRSNVESVVEFSLQYEGPAVDAGNMDVLDLAPALLALGRLCRDTNRLLNRDEAEVSVQVRAQPRIGSFIVDLHLAQAIQSAQQFVNSLIENPNIKTGKEILETIGVYYNAVQNTIVGSVLVVHSVIGLIKAKKGQDIANAEPAPGDTFNLTIEGNVIINVPADVYNVYRDAAVRDDLSRLVEPLDKDGIDQLTFISPRETQESITKDEARFFRPSAAFLDDDVLSIDDSTRFWQTRSTSNDPSLLWHFLEGGSAKVNAYMRDDDFLRRMNLREQVVLPGDVMQVRVRTVTTRGSSNKLHSRNEIVHVIGIYPQLRFEFEPGNNEEDA